MGPVDPSPAPAVTVNAASSGRVELMPPLGATPSSGYVGERRARRHEGGDAPWVGWPRRSGAAFSPWASRRRARNGRPPSSTRSSGSARCESPTGLGHVLGPRGVFQRGVDGRVTRRAWGRCLTNPLVGYQPRRGRIDTPAWRNARARVLSCTPNSSATSASDAPSS